MPTLAATLRFLLLVALLAAGNAAYALDLDQAKREGLVGETMEGYVDVVDASAPAEVKVLVEETNAKRHAEYQRIARQNGLEIEQVEALAAKKAIDKTRIGDWVRVNGSWRQK
jgi:hypothetical protein